MSYTNRQTNIAALIFSCLMAAAICVLVVLATGRQARLDAANEKIQELRDSLAHIPFGHPLRPTRRTEHPDYHRRYTPNGLIYYECHQSETR